MTDWIDALRDGLKGEEKQKNHEHAIKLRDDEIIKEHAQPFWRKFVEEVLLLVDELNEKLGASLGGVTVSPRQTERSFTVTVASHGAVETVKVEGKLSESLRAITIDISRTGNRYTVAPQSRRYTFAVEASDRVVAKLDKGESFDDPEKMADAIMRGAFTADLFRPY